MTKIDAKTAAAMQAPDTTAVPIELTPEMKAHFSRISNQIVDLLKANTKTPMEAYMVLHFIMASLEEIYGIRGALAVTGEDGD